MNALKKMYLNYWLVITLFMFCVSSVTAQSTHGKEFWVTFGQSYTRPPTSPILKLYIRIVSNHTPTTGTIYFTALDTTVNFSMGAYEVYDHTLTIEQRIAVYNTIMGVTNKSLHIISNEPVAVYAQNGDYLASATNILPVTALGAEYYQISHPNLRYQPLENFSDAYAVVATQNNTRLSHNGGTEIELNAGEVYYKTDTAYSDMTGAHITANYPVAFFALHPFALAPFESSEVGNPLFQQLAPVNTWGRSFFVPSSHFARDIVRIVASQNHTDITQVEGGTLRLGAPGAQSSLLNLPAGKFVEIADSDSGCYIKADKPVEVCSFLTSWFSWPSSCTPSQCWIPAIEQTIFHTQIASMLHVDSYLNEPYALVCTPTNTKDSSKVSVNGNTPTALTGGNWTENAAANMSFYTMPISDTEIYTFTNPKGLIVLCYATGSFGMTYYYLAGSGMRALDAIFYANNVHFQDLEENPICENSVTFRAELDNMGVAMDSIKWFINGVKENLPYNQLEWSKTFIPGNYEITMWVRFENDSTISKTGMLKIKNCEVTFYVNNVHYLYDTTFCAKNVTFQAEIEDFTATPENLKWYIGDNEYIPAQGLMQWNKDFETGNYPIKMWALLENDVEIEITGTLKIEVRWIKIKNIRY